MPSAVVPNNPHKYRGTHLQLGGELGYHFVLFIASFGAVAELKSCCFSLGQRFPTHGPLPAWYWLVAAGQTSR